jgi:release factor glutamine methyltransferase
MNIAEFLSQARKKLISVSNTPELDSELLLSEVLHKPQEFLFSRPKYLLSIGQKQKAGMFLQKRMMGRPIAQIIGKKGFYGLEFMVNEHVLIPRPETEILVEKVIKLLSQGGTLIDVGTGSGCIALSVTKFSAVEKIFALDICPRALSVAEKNAEEHNICSINFLQSDIFSDFPKDLMETFPKPVIIAANLPYVPHREKHPSTKYEPNKALYSGDDGLSHYRQFFFELKDIFFSACVFEFHPPQKQKLENEVRSLFPNGRQHFFQDYAGFWRIGFLEC